MTDTALQAVVDAQAGGGPAELVAFVYSQDPRVAARALFALGSMREDFAFQAVLQALSHADSTVRANAAFAMGQIPRGATTRWLFRALESEPVPTVRRAITAALGHAGDETAGDSLVALGPDVPEAVLVLALGRIALRHPPGEATLDRLLRGLDSPDGEVRELAAWYFGRTPDVTQWSSHAARLRRALDRYALDDPAAGGLLRALGRLAEPGDLDAVLRFRESPDWRLRVRTAAALDAFIGQDAAREALFQALDDPSTHVAVAAATSLGAIRRLLDEDKDRAEAWIQAHPAAWRTASPLLGALAAQGRGSFVAAWLESRSQEPARVRAHGIRALAQTPDQGVIRTLMDLARSDTTEIATAAVEGLVGRWETDRTNRELHRAYWEAFSQALGRGDRAAVVAIAPLMPDSVFRSMGSLELLADVYDGLRPVEDIEAQQAVVAALEAMGDPAAVPVLRRAVEDPQRTLRIQAGPALEAVLRERVEPSLVPNPPARVPDWDLLRGLGPHPTLVLETDKGTVRIRMTTELTPVTVQTVRELAESGRYDGVPFHRVVPDFVVQGGDVERADGYGGPGFALRTEISGIPFLRGVVGLAAAGPDTEGSQFFVTHSRQAHLDDAYVAFGWVEEGMDVVDRLYEGDRILHAHVEPDAAGVGTATGS